MFLCALIAALSIALRARRSSTAVGRFDVDARQLLVFETLSLRFNLLKCCSRPPTVIQSLWSSFSKDRDVHVALTRLPFVFDEPPINQRDQVYRYRYNTGTRYCTKPRAGPARARVRARRYTRIGYSQRYAAEACRGQSVCRQQYRGVRVPNKNHRTLEATESSY